MNNGTIHRSEPETLHPSARALAFYLPQFHRIPENDAWWGEGFTEWTQVSRAQQWFSGHRLRRPVPPLGAYDLLEPCTMELQQHIAQSHGVQGFLVWDYWLGGGRQLLEKPIEQALRGGLAFNYALAWANHSWTDRLRNRLLIEQQYLGTADYEAYFDRCWRHFVSDRYIRVDDKPLFFIYRPENIPDLECFVDTWRERALRRGLRGLFLVGDYVSRTTAPSATLDAYSNVSGYWTAWKRIRPNLIGQIRKRVLGMEAGPQRYDFSSVLKDYLPSHPPRNFMPTVITGWDTTIRHGARGVVYDGLSTEAFRDHLALSKPLLTRGDASQRILLVKSWNEWAEGNVLEPDSEYGDGLLKTFAEFMAELAHPGPASMV